MALSRFNNTEAYNQGFGNHMANRIPISYDTNIKCNRSEHHILYETQDKKKSISLPKSTPKPNTCVNVELFLDLLSRLSAKNEQRFDFDYSSIAVNVAININGYTYSILAERENGEVLSYSCSAINLSVKELFESILSKVNCIRNLYIIVCPKYGNESRKTLIKLGKTYAANVKIIENQIAEFLTATDQHFLPNFNVLWILNGKNVTVWQNHNEIVKCIGYINRKMSLNEEDIVRIKNLTVNKDPDIIFYTDKKNYMFHIQRTLPNSSLLLYEQECHSYIALIKSNITFDTCNGNFESEYTREIQNTLLYGLKFLYGVTEVASFERFSTLPLIKIFELKSNDADYELQVYKNNEWQQTLRLPQFDKAFIKICVDTNGIYSAKIFNDAQNKKITVKQVIQTGSLIDHNDILKYMFPPKICNNKDNIHAVGIDLGTTQCCAAVNRAETIATVALDQGGERQLPAYVAYDGRLPICGKIVIQRLQNHAESSVFDAKRFIGKRFGQIIYDQAWPFNVDKVCTVMPKPIDEDEGVEYQDNQIQIELQNGKIKKYPEEISADLLKYIKQKAEEFQGKMLSKCVITIPGGFNNNQKKATASAAKLAGWEKVFLLPESVAAVFGYYVERPIPLATCILLFDLGGGTSEVCIFEVKQEKLLLISRINDSQLGGRDFDNVLINHFKEILEQKYGIEMTKRMTYKLMLKCQEIKVTLSSANEANLAVDDFDFSSDAFISITRPEFLSLSTGLITRVQQNIKKTLGNVGLRPHDINKVLHVGGGSRMPMIQNLLHETFPISEQCKCEHPDELVAVGAAHYAYHIYPMDLTEKEEFIQIFSYAFALFSFFWRNKSSLMVFVSIFIYLWLLYVSPWKHKKLTTFLTDVLSWILIIEASNLVYRLFRWIFAFKIIKVVLSAVIVLVGLPIFLWVLYK